MMFSKLIYAVYWFNIPCPVDTMLINLSNYWQSSHLTQSSYSWSS